MGVGVGVLKISARLGEFSDEDDLAVDVQRGRHIDGPGNMRRRGEIRFPSLHSHPPTLISTIRDRSSYRAPFHT
jgi:hypothetical protein